MRPGQVHHPHPARHQRRAPRRTGQQRADLGGVVGVVEEDQDAAAVQRRAVQRGPLVQGVGDRRVGRAERPQERAEDRLRLRDPRPRALEVDVELSVREVPAGLVGDVHGQRRLADAADSGDRGDGHHRALGGGQPAAQLGHERGPAGEVRHRGGKLRGPQRGGRGGRLVRRTGQFLVGAQDALLELGQFGARVDAQLLREEPAGVRVHREGLGLPAAAVQRHHQQLAQPLAQRVRGGERGQLGDGLRVTADLQVQVEPRLGELEPPLLQPGPLVVRVRAGHGGQRLAVPQAQHLVDQGARLAAVAGRAGLLRLRRQILRQRQVERRAVGPDRVAAGFAHQGVLAQDLAQPGGVRPDRGQRLRGRFLAPERVDQLARGGRPALAQQQRGQQGALLGRSGREQFRAPPDPYGAEHGEPEGVRRDRHRRSTLLRYAHAWPAVTVH